MSKGKTKEVLFNAGSSKFSMTVNENLVELFEQFASVGIMPFAHNDDLFEKQLKNKRQVLIVFFTEKDLKFFVEKVIEPFDDRPGTLYSRMTKDSSPWEERWKYQLHIDDISIESKRIGKKVIQTATGLPDLNFYYEVVFPFTDLQLATEKMKEYVKSQHNKENKNYSFSYSPSISDKKYIN